MFLYSDLISTNFAAGGCTFVERVGQAVYRGSGMGGEWGLRPHTLRIQPAAPAAIRPGWSFASRVSRVAALQPNAA